MYSEEEETDMMLKQTNVSGQGKLELIMIETPL